MKTSLLLLTLALLAGCNTGRIKTPGGITIDAPKNASAPSSVKEGQRAVRTGIPAGTTVVKENIEATPQSPAIERETTTYAEATERVETEINSEVSLAPPRAPDQAVALRNADNEARAPMLYASIAALFLTGVLLYAGKLELAAVSGSISAALGLCWYAFGSPLFMAAAFALVACGVGFLIWRQNKKSRVTTEALRRMIQTGEELKMEKPASAEDLREYNDANMDEEHKKLLQDLKPSINDKYLREIFSKQSKQP